jgi:hypothetical protein
MEIKQEIIKQFEELIDFYGGRDMETYNTSKWELLSFEDQNPEIQKTMKLVQKLKELWNVN